MTKKQQTIIIVATTFGLAACASLKLPSLYPSQADKIRVVALDAHDLADAGCSLLPPEDQQAAASIIAPVLVQVEKGDLAVARLLIEQNLGRLGQWTAAFNLLWRLLPKRLSFITNAADWTKAEEQVVGSAACGCAQGLGLSYPKQCDELLK